MSRTEDGREVLRLYEGLKKQREGFEKTWAFARWFLLPNREGEERNRPSDFVGEVQNGTAGMSCARLAGAHMSHIVTSHEPWFKWSARPGDVEEEEEEEANAWYGKCSQIALTELTRSNFYSEIHECFEDRVGLGTGCMYCGPGRKSRLLFKAIHPDQSCGEFDEYGELVVFVREMMLSAYDVVDLFGAAALSDEMKADYDGGLSAMYEKKWVVIHIVRRAKTPKLGRGWEGMYVDAKGKRVMKREMEWEMPYMATRWKKNGSCFYGFAPWMTVKGEIKNVERIEKDLDKARRVAVDPRILELAEQVGVVDLRAGGRTVISLDGFEAGGQFPKEWASVGDVTLAYKQLADKENRIKEAFLVPMLELFAYDEDKKGFPTATEVMARENERLVQFFPSFVQFAYDVQCLLDRVFMVLYRDGAFPEPPECVKEPVFRGKVKVGMVLKNPGVTYNNKVALVLKRIESDAFMAVLREAAELSEAFPGMLDHFNTDHGVRARARAMGVSEHDLVPEDDVDGMRQEAQMKMQGQNDLGTMAQAAAAQKDLAAAQKLQAEANQAGA